MQQLAFIDSVLTFSCFTLRKYWSHSGRSIRPSDELTTKGQPVTVQAIYSAESEHTGENSHLDMVPCDRETVRKRNERENSVTHFEMVVQRQVKKSVQSDGKCTVG
jgi:hypothetical protein